MKILGVARAKPEGFEHGTGLEGGRDCHHKKTVRHLVSDEGVCLARLYRIFLIRAYPAVLLQNRFQYNLFNLVDDLFICISVSQAPSSQGLE